MAVVKACFLLCNRTFRKSTASFLPHAQSNFLRNLNGVFPPSTIKQKSTKAGDDNKQSQPSQGDFKLPNPERIFVRNIGQTTEDGLFKYFSKYGEIEWVKVCRKWMSRLSREIGFVTFCDPESAMKVLSHTHVIDENNVTVERGVKQRNEEKRERAYSEEQRTVLITNILKSTSKEMIENHFSQFGKVENAVLAQKGEKDDLDSYYIVFSSLSAVKRSLEEPTHVIAEQGINSKVIEVSKIGKTVEKSTRLLVLHIPDEITVDDLRDYFQNFGDVEYLELTIHKGRHSNVAFVHFQNESTVDKVVKDQNHIINGSQVEVAKHKSLDVPQQPAKQKLAVMGLPESASTKEVKKFFKKGFRIKVNSNNRVNAIRKDLVENTTVYCIVEFENKSDLERVLTQTDVKFRGVPLHFRQLVWRKEGQETAVI